MSFSTSDYSATRRAHWHLYGPIVPSPSYLFTRHRLHRCKLSSAVVLLLYERRLERRSAKQSLEGFFSWRAWRHPITVAAAAAGCRCQMKTRPANLCTIRVLHAAWPTNGATPAGCDS